MRGRGATGTSRGSGRRGAVDFVLHAEVCGSYKDEKLEN